MRIIWRRSYKTIRVGRWTLMWANTGRLVQASPKYVLSIFDCGDIRGRIVPSRWHYAWGTA